MLCIVPGTDLSAAAVRCAGQVSGVDWVCVLCETCMAEVASISFLAVSASPAPPKPNHPLIACCYQDLSCGPFRIVSATCRGICSVEAFLACVGWLDAWLVCGCVVV